MTKSQNGPLLTDIIDTFRTWCSKPPPKGFEKFFKDKPGAKKAAGEAEAAAESKASGESKAAKPKAPPRARVEPPKRKEAKAENDLSELFKRNFGGGASGGGGMNDQDKQKWQQLIGLGVVTVIGLGLMAQSRYREISWKEFVETHLSRGTVERLEVINSKWVKVILKAGMDSEVIWFSIGSPDRFERNL